MVVAELMDAEYEQRMPTPGSYSHLEFLSRLETQDLRHLHPRDFLSDTNATKTLAVFIKRQRIFRPIRTPHIELDTRLLQTPETWIPLFHGSIYRDPKQPQNSLLTISGRPQPWETGKDNFEYHMILPVDFQFNYDDSRPSQASFRYGEGLLDRGPVYNQAAFPEYKEDDPTVLYEVIKQASSDLAMIARYTYGIDRVPGYIPEGPAEHSTPAATSRQRVAQTIANLLK